MTELSRRDALKLLATGTAAGAFAITDDVQLRAAAVARTVAEGSAAPYAPKFFTAHEWATVRMLADYIIPRDERSGSATEAGAPEYIDFILADQTPAPKRMAPSPAQVAMRGGLAWLDGESRRRFTTSFLQASDAQRRQLLDDIAWPAKARPEMRPGVAFFTRMRDMTAAGFFSSKMGVRDVQYLGNAVVTEWKGCPPEALRHVGLADG
jgi:hypothetical protein